MNKSNINYKDISLHYKIWLSTKDNKSIMGGGRLKLLKTIDENGSLTSAVKLLGISYRKAWGDLKKAETLLEFKLVDKHRGGQKGGSTLLTQKGKKLLIAYEKLNSDIDNHIQNSFNKFMKNLNSSNLINS